MSTVRHTAIQRLANSASFSNRRISQTPTVHSSPHEDEKPVEISPFKQEKLNAGLRATEEQNYIEAIKQFSLVKPDTSLSLYLCGCARLSMNYYYQIQEAIIDFTKCLEITSRTREPPFILQVRYRLGQAYHRIHRYEDALRDYTEFIRRCESAGEQGPENLPKGLVARGQTYQALFELDKALKDMNRANELTDESNPYYLCCRASVYGWKNDKQKAEADLTKAAEIGYENDCQALLQRAKVFSELDQHQAAIENLERAFTLERDPPQLAEFSYRLGLEEYALNKKMQALRSFEQAVSFHPFHSQAYYYAGKIQAAKDHHKQALKALNRAHELAPQQPDILFERAMVNRALGHVDDANDDEKRATQLNSAPSIALFQLIERIKKLRQEMMQHRSSPTHHLELATMLDGLLNMKKRFKARIEHYREAVAAYRRCIELDSKYQYPQARALLILCYQKMNGIVEAHELHLRFYDQMDEHPEAINRWKTYLVQMTDRIESGEKQLYLDEHGLSRLVQVEFNRRKKDIDEEKFRNDTEDKHQSQLIFYQRLRTELSHILASIAILNLDHEQIISTNQQTSNQLERYIELFKKNITSIEDIQAMLIDGIYASRKTHNSLDIQLIRMKLNGFAHYIGDTIDYVDVSQLVARHICTRYRSQLLCLNPVPTHSLSMIDFSTSSTHPSSSSSSSSSWWSCCQNRPSSPNLSRPATSIDHSNNIERIASFAIAFVISSINRETNRIPSNMRTPRKDALATRLVLMISRAHSDHPLKYPLRIDQETVLKMLQESSESETDLPSRTIEWDLYEFFRAPGIYYETNEGNCTTYFYASGPLMRADIYGYRLGTPEEIDTMRVKYSKKVFY